MRNGKKTPTQTTSLWSDRKLTLNESLNQEMPPVDILLARTFCFYWTIEFVRFWSMWEKCRNHDLSITLKCDSCFLSLKSRCCYSFDAIFILNVKIDECHSPEFQPLIMTEKSNVNQYLRINSFQINFNQLITMATSFRTILCVKLR